MVSAPMGSLGATGIHFIGASALLHRLSLMVTHIQYVPA